MQLIVLSVFRQTVLYVQIKRVCILNFHNAASRKGVTNTLIFFDSLHINPCILLYSCLVWQKRSVSSTKKNTQNKSVRLTVNTIQYHTYDLHGI